VYEVKVKTEFSAAHQLIGHGGLCKNMHGHNWVVEASFKNETLNSQGMVIDFADVMKELEPIIKSLDHQTINDIPPFDKINPTAENIAKWIFDSLKEKLAIKPSSVTIYETSKTLASYYE